MLWGGVCFTTQEPRGWQLALLVTLAALQTLAQESTTLQTTDTGNSSTLSSPDSSRSTTTLPPPTDTWTILAEGYLLFHPVASTLQDPKLDLALTFKTKQPHGLLFCHLVTPKASQEMYYGRLTEDLEVYHFCVELYQGTLRITHKLNQYEDIFTIGKEYNDDEWHEVKVSLDTSSGHLQVTIDGEVHNKRVRTFTWTRPSDLLDSDLVSPVVRYGSGVSLDQFVGCLRDLIFGREEVRPEETHRVKAGCVDLCVTHNKCAQGTRCINQYTDMHCDCFGSDNEGKYCNSTKTTVVTLRGYEWIKYQLYRRPKDKMLMDNTRISLQFKSDRGSGVLIYAVGGAPYNSHLIASVHEGTVRVSMAFGDDVIQEQMGIGVDDQRWHNLTIVHSPVEVNFLLDGESHRHSLDPQNFHLSFDPQIYFGGGDNFVTTQGLQVTQNFVGCLKNVYVNDISLLPRLVEEDPRTQLKGGTMPQQGCRKVKDIPMTFPKSGTMLLFDGYGGQDLTVELEFRTVRQDAVLLYFNLLSPGNVDTGNLEVWVRNGQPLLHYVSSLSNGSHTRNTTVAMVVNNNRWHTLRLEFKAGMAKVRIGSRSVVLEGVGEPIYVSGAIIVGFVPKIYTENIGFVGCIRNLKLQNETIDPIKLMDNRDVVDGVFLDGCNLVDHCRYGPPCQHGGQCLADWDGISCNCEATSYSGKTCHFSRYKQTCDEYYQAGYTESGVYLLDLDGQGPMEPHHAQCEMGHTTLDPQGGHDVTGATVVEHNLAPYTPIRDPELGELKKVLSYREMNHEILLKLTRMSDQCQQYVEYSCYRAPIRLGDLTFFRAASGQVVESIGTDTPGHCACALGNQCPANGCMCDRAKSSVVVDKGDNSVKAQLPITELTILNKRGGSSKGTANITLGPLKCWGSNDNKLDHAVTFTAQMAHIVLQPWTSFDLRFSFRTHQQSAVLLHQSPQFNNSNMFSIELLTAKALRFFFVINDVEFVSDIQTNEPLNTGAWKQIRVERSQHDIRCSVAREQRIVTIPEIWTSDDAIFSGLLYLGGLPGEMFEETPGLVGCVRGMVYNGVHHDLTSETDPSTPEVKPGCTASCWTDPCQNGASCVEGWGTYQCVCANPWAHMGHSCEININEDAVSFNGSITSFLEVGTGEDLSMLESTIIVSFRTTIPPALLLYIYDHLNNFVQLEVTGVNQLRLSYNHFDVIKEGVLIVDGLTDGTWKQVVVQFLQGGDRGVKLILDDLQTIVPFRTLKLSQYSDHPFNTGELRESVFPLREAGSSPFVRLFVGGTSSLRTSIPTINGCMRGLKIGSRVISLQELARHTPGVAGACHSGCVNKPCHHGGYCWEKWGLSDYECDCTNTAYAGKQCDIEASGTFDGQSVVEYMFRPNGQARQTSTDKVSLVFQTNATGSEPMVLIVVISSSHTDHDFVTLWMKPDGGVHVTTSQGGVHHGLSLDGMFADGRPHKLVYQHTESEMSLKVLGTSNVDVEAMETVPISNNPLQVLDTVLVGGFTPTSVYDNFSHRNKYRNFTGCLSVVRFEPVAGARMYLQQPLKTLRDNLKDSIVIHGNKVPPCSSPIAIDLQHDATTTTTHPTTANGGMQKLMMPPWNPGPAETIFLNPAPPKTSSSTPSPTIPVSLSSTQATTPQANLTRPRPVLESRFMNDETIVILMCVIVFILLITIIITLILWRFKKKKGYRFKQKEDYEMKQPLNHTCGSSSPVSPALSAPGSPAIKDHLARLDEFSMVSATLGPSLRRHENGIRPGGLEPLLSQEEDVPEYTMQTFFNKKKNRPASSISEVLEEMERQRRRDPDPGRGVGASPQEEGPPDWEVPGPAPEFDEQEVDGKDTGSDPLLIDGPVTHHTADSGYEAESRPETNTPSPPSPQKSYLDESITSPPSPKSYLYELAGFSGSEVPNCASTPRKSSTDSSPEVIT
ncbi:contactin-associated protein-like 2 isoform X2 [Mizuhopecten yessoensis]|uniref:contactin-associated protein-like 2 isoform X2 n=1 Tax=Mizuhopecten yessoensis TaxID=6573 RepID=UPI000B45F88B|nr:contactin-associated protein-like 2 isoform X2 [Mizuhopecten yessoensis]